MQQKVQAVYQYKWDMRKFPFDTAILKIELEDYRDANEITFIADRENSGVSNLINVDGWEIISSDNPSANFRAVELFLSNVENQRFKISTPFSLLDLS